MIGSVNDLMTAFEKAYAEYEWTDFLWEIVIRWRVYEQDPKWDPDLLESVRVGVVQMLGMAVAAKDSTIFRRIAEILDALPQGDAADIDLLTIVPGGDLTPLRFVVKARASLESDAWLKPVPRTDVTKKKVRLLAMRMWAIARLNAQGKVNRSSRLTPAKREKLIQAELERLPDQDWTEVFKKAGCHDLYFPR
jgi:hypothetical protein